MVILTLSGRSYEIAPYKLGPLRRAAPHVDALNAYYRDKGEEMLRQKAEIEAMADDGARAAALAEMVRNSSMVEMMAPVGILAEIVAIGMQKLDPKFTAEYLLEEEIGFDDQAALSAAVNEIMRASGLAAKSGEAAAPSELAEAEGASQTNSVTSSAS